MIKHKCANCAILKANNGVCPFFQYAPISGTGCPNYTAHLDPCDICGNHIIGTKFWVIDENETKEHQICGQCGQRIAQNRCIACQKANYCAFQQDTNCQLPPMVMVEMREGNAVMQTQIKNPDRIAATCAINCDCYNKDSKICMREIGGCNNHRTLWRNE